MESSNSQRIYFLDALRAFVIALVVFYHVTIHYVSQFQIMPFVQNVVPRDYNTPFLLLLLGVNGQTMNSVMFFIAGYFALAPLIKKGSKVFLKDKLVRLGVPYLFGLALLSPVAGYMAYSSWGNRMGFFQYWLSEFYNYKNINPFHLWFIGVLLFFFAVLCLVFSVFRDQISAMRVQAGKFPFRSAFLFITITTVLYFAVNIFYSGVNYTNLYIINFQTVMLLIYAAYFVLGIHAYRKNWFRSGYRPRIIPWAISFIISIVAYLALVIYMFVVGAPLLSVPNIALILFNQVSILSALMMLLALFQKYANSGSTFAGKLSAASFSTYIFHYIVVYALVYFMRNASIPLFAKYFTQVAAGLLLSWGVGYFIRKAPALGKRTLIVKSERGV